MTRQSATEQLTRALHQWWDLQREERQGKLPRLSLVRGRKLSIDQAWAACGADAEPVYHAAAESWRALRGCCHDCGATVLCPWPPQGESR